MTTRSILLGDRDPLMVERKILDALTGRRELDLNLAMCLAADSNDEEICAKFLMAAATEMVERNRSLALAAAIDTVFANVWGFLLRFSNSPNDMIPRRLVGGIALGIFKMRDVIDMPRYIVRIITIPRLPSFMYVTTGETERAITKIVREWSVDHVGQAKQVLAEVSHRMTEEWAYPEPTPLGKIVFEAVFYGLMSRLSFKSKLQLARF